MVFRDCQYENDLEDKLKKVDQLTDMLSRTCTMIEEKKLWHLLEKDIHDWWRLRKVQEAKRIEREKTEQLARKNFIKNQIKNMIAQLPPEDVEQLKNEGIL